MLVADRMHRDVITIDREASLRRARRVMESHRIRHLPVVESRRVVGVVTERDLRQASPSSVGGLSPRDREEFMDTVRVGHVMTRRIISVAPRTPVGDAARLLLRYRIGCLPVVEDRQLVGMLTTSDLVELLAEILGGLHSGDRVAVEVPDEPGRLESLLRIAGTHQARVMSLVNLPPPPGERRVLLRVPGDAAPICEALGAAGFRLAFRPGLPGGEDALILEHLVRSHPEAAGGIGPAAAEGRGRSVEGSWP